jgi:UDP-N-acetylglucosamine--N-acetylmuramyl-(pentapeptide) pyrophosphoryl-undecaprenol N-acetylglucosamine transferase
MSRTVLIAGGGTGGHVFPGVAVAHALRELADVEIVFCGSPRGLESKIVPEQGFRLEMLDVEPIKGGGPGRAIKGALVAAKAMRHASALVKRLRPAAALSVGGYAAGPASLACVGARVPLAILEPNSILGLSNRVLAPFAKHAYVAWAETARVFRGDKARLHGVPLRPQFAPRPYAAKPDRRRLLVLGGSQGAQALNERVPVAVSRAVAKIGDIVVVHQAGRDRDAAVREAYARAGVQHVTVVPFLDDVAEQMAAADVILARAGANTVAEIAAIGRASVLVPFPHAADDHQAKNAAALAELGGAVCVRQEAADEVRIAGELALLFGDPERRSRMALAAREHGRPHAARDVAADLLELARIPRRARPAPTKANGHVNGSPSPIHAGKEVS